MKPSLLAHPAFAADFARLRGVTLDPARHLLPDAETHSRAVAARARQLATASGLGDHEVDLLETLGLVHDIGKIAGTTAPAASVELLPRYGIDDPAFLDLVRYHDINLPWHQLWTKQQAPGDKAWRKMTGRVDMHLLCLFMVADRVDCPGGFRCNAPLTWFLGEAERRGLLSRPLVLDA